LAPTPVRHSSRDLRLSGLDAFDTDGLLAGLLLGFVVLVFGGPAWFAMLLAFYGIGALSTKFRYERKLDRGIAEENDGARDGMNVLANSAAATLSVLAYAAVESGVFGGTENGTGLGAVDPSALDEQLFLFAFCGALATALGDTLSSEIGGLFDTPRLITTLEPVPAGTDGAVTWQGKVAGVTGGAVIAAIVLLAAQLDRVEMVGATGATLVVFAGVVGMTVDSLLGATVEGNTIGNEGVNFLATAAGALAGLLLAALFGVPG